MIRALKWLWHSSRGDRWMRFAQAKATVSRDAFVDSRLGAERARVHYARADELYPPRPRGPPEGLAPADGDRAPPNT